MTNIKIIGDRLLIRRKHKAMSEALVIPDAVVANHPERHFEATVTQVGDKPSEEVAIGDSIIVTHCGSQKVIVNGEELEIISMLDVVAIGAL